MNVRSASVTLVLAAASLSLMACQAPKSADATETLAPVVIGPENITVVAETTLGTTVANLGMTDTRFPGPVFAGDTIRSRTTVKEVRESKSRPNAGIVTFLHQGLNQRGEEVCVCTRQALMLRKPQ